MIIGAESAYGDNNLPLYCLCYEQRLAPSMLYITLVVLQCTYLPTCLKQKVGQNSSKNGTFGLKAGHSHKFDKNS